MNRIKQKINRDTVKIINSIFFLISISFIDVFALSKFYFVRHGQTDFNVGKQKKYKNDLMNHQGINEIKRLKNTVKSLSIEVIYFSPLKRTVQTKDILNKSLSIPEICLCEIEEIRTKFLFEKSKNKIKEISKGLNKILADSRLALVVGHKNIYKAICDILDIKTDLLNINNAALVCFYQDNKAHWKVTMIQDGSKSLH